MNINLEVQIWEEHLLCRTTVVEPDSQCCIKLQNILRHVQCLNTSVPEFIRLYSDTIIS